MNTYEPGAVPSLLGTIEFGTFPYRVEATLAGSMNKHFPRIPVSALGARYQFGPQPLEDTGDLIEGNYTITVVIADSNGQIKTEQKSFKVKKSNTPGGGGTSNNILAAINNALNVVGIQMANLTANQQQQISDIVGNISQTVTVENNNNNANNLNVINVMQHQFSQLLTLLQNQAQNQSGGSGGIPAVNVNIDFSKFMAGFAKGIKINNSSNNNNKASLNALAEAAIIINQQGRGGGGSGSSGAAKPKQVPLPVVIPLGPDGYRTKVTRKMNLNTTTYNGKLFFTSSVRFNVSREVGTGTWWQKFVLAIRTDPAGKGDGTWLSYSEMRKYGIYLSVLNTIKNPERVIPSMVRAGRIETNPIQLTSAAKIFEIGFGNETLKKSFFNKLGMHRGSKLRFYLYSIVLDGPGGNPIKPDGTPASGSDSMVSAGAYVEIVYA